MEIAIRDKHTSKLLGQLGGERRRIVSLWRLRVLLSRLALSTGGAPPDRKSVERFATALIRRGDLTTIEGVRGVFRVDTAFANVVPVSDEQIVLEANPWCVFHLLTALSHHGLTDLIPRGRLQAAYFQGSAGGARLPLGTMPEDWLEVAPPRPAFPTQVGAVRVEWMRQRARFEFGVSTSLNQGAPIYVTDIERSLVDTIRWPRRAGGITVVLGAWRSARERLALDRLVEYVERCESPVLTQRAGYLIESVGLTHAALDRWRARLQRGGSLRLVADAPYASAYAERWNLSLNAPASALAELRGDQHE